MLSFGPHVDPSRISQHTRTVLEELLTESGNPSALVTSGERSPADQARIMFANLDAHGVAAQRALYLPPGNAVIDVYVHMKGDDSPDEIRQAMEAKIVELGPEHVSKHCADPKVLQVVDIAPSSLTHPQSFESAAREDARVSKVLSPSGHDPAYHIEIPQS